ncbi:MAG: glycosyltransferase family A protein [Flavobacteriales bacterium]
MKVAVVIPCYNVEHHVHEAVRSVMEQTYEDIDVVAIDDGSTDSTREQLVRLSEKYPGKLRWESGPRKGACAARNRGMALTEGDYVQFLDADDMILTDKIHRQVDLANATGGPDLVVGDFLNVYEDSKEELIRGAGHGPWSALIRTQLGTTSANLFKRSAVLAAGGWNPKQASSQDYELMFRMLMNDATVAWDPHVSSLVLKRSSGSISRTDLSANWKRYIALRQEIRDYLRSTDPVKFAKEVEVGDQYVFMAIRVLSKHDREAALAEYDRCMDSSFVPEHSKATTSMYIAFYRMLGFRMAERSAMLMGWLKDRMKLV